MWAWIHRCLGRLIVGSRSRIGKDVKFIFLSRTGDASIKIADRVEIRDRVELRVRGGGRIILGAGAVIDSDVRIVASNCVISIGECSKISKGCVISGGADISIGSYTGISAYTVVTSSTHEKDSAIPYMKQGWIEKPVVIGSDVQIGTHCHVMAGSIIGNQATLAPSTVIAKCIPECAIMAGNPSRLVGERK